MQKIIFYVLPVRNKLIILFIFFILNLTNDLTNKNNFTYFPVVSLTETKYTNVGCTYAYMYITPLFLLRLQVDLTYIKVSHPWYRECICSFGKLTVELAYYVLLKELKV